MPLTFDEIQAVADRGGFRQHLDTALEREAAVRRKIESKLGLRMTATVREVCLQSVRYSFEQKINQCFGQPVDPEQVFDLRFYAECYALAMMIQRELDLEKNDAKKS
jgi:hypothetical protein